MLVMSRIAGLRPGDLLLRPLAWRGPFGGTGEDGRRSPVEIVATMGENRVQGVVSCSP